MLPPAAHLSEADMDIVKILDLVTKGLNVISTLESVGQSVAPAVKVVADLVTGASAGVVTDQQLADTETILDKMITDFNLPL
jgi:hypothetical protein